MTLTEAEKMAKIVLRLQQDDLSLRLMRDEEEKTFRAVLIRAGRAQFVQEGQTPGAALLKLLSFYGADLQRRVDESQRTLDDWKEL